MPGAQVFREGQVSQLELQINPQELQGLEKEAREFVRANVRDSEVTYTDVAIHLKGSIGSFRPLNDKPGFTLDFARFAPNQRFHGLRRIHLNNSVEDPSYCNEALGAELFRAAGIPAPRVARAMVTLNGRRLGLYVLKEAFTEDFLSCYFHTVGENLYEPDEGHDINEHLKKSSVRGVPSNRKALKKLSEAALDSDSTRRWARLSDVLEMDRFLKFMALEVLLCHRDGYCLARNNFRVYENVDTGKMLFLPHGMDQLFAVPELPWVPHMAGLVARAVLDTSEGTARYTQISKDLFHQMLPLEQLTNRVHQLIGELRPALSESDFKRIDKSGNELIERISKRHQFLETQMSHGPAELLKFTNGTAGLTNWAKVDEPESGRMRIEPGPGGVLCLQIKTRKGACPSWHARALLAPGRYRFEGKVRVAAVNPLDFGTHHGAGLRVGGQMRGSLGLTGTTEWRTVSAPFEVRGVAQEMEFICELRAESGEAWFDKGSLCVVQEP